MQAVMAREVERGAIVLISPEVSSYSRSAFGRFLRLVGFIGELLLGCKPMILRGTLRLPTLLPNLVSTLVDQIVSADHVGYS
jgi:hypothetical protein